MEANPADIKEDWHIETINEPKLPRDEAGEIQMALAATTPRGNQPPLISVLTARERILRLPNPDSEADRIDEERITSLIESQPSYIIRKYAKSLIEKGDKEGAEEFLAGIQGPQGSIGGGGMQGQPSGAPGATQMQQGGIPQGQGVGGGIPQPSPEEVQQLMAMAESLLQQGKPIPLELEQILRQVMPQGGGMPPNQM